MGWHSTQRVDARAHTGVGRGAGDGPMTEH